MLHTEFNPLDFLSCLEKPRYAVYPSTWTEHIPFMFVLMQLLKPKILVELGTHKGDSYCAFCQAVVALELNTQCYAIDSWKGDMHSGFYGSKVYEELKAYHDPLYGKFSKLLKCQFDEGVKHFTDKSIDLLHIDGLHFYEAVRHDFETWLPKMSSMGVILFHDTQVREKGFGVWKLWEEVKERFQNFEFNHGYGLGVLFIGSEALPRMQILIESMKNQSTKIRNFFSFIGEKDLLRREIIQMNRQIIEKDQQLVQINQQVIEKDQQLVQINQQVIEKDQQLVQKDQQLVQINQQLNEKDQQVIEKEKQIAEKDHYISVVFNSLSWKITRPLRWIHRQLVRLFS